MGVGVLHRRLHWLILATCAFSFLSLTPFGRLHQASLGLHGPVPKCLLAGVVEDRKPQEIFHSAAFLKGPPTAHFQDNLLEDQFYVTSWTIAGFTNQFIAYVNLLYLASLTERIPILPPFVPNHHVLRVNGFALPFGDVFDLPRLRQALRRPVIEWHEVKHLEDPISVKKPSMNTSEPIGCWTTRPGRLPPVWSQAVVNNLALDPSYTRLPPSIHMPAPRNDFVNLHRLASHTHFLQTGTMMGESPDIVPSPSTGHSLPPSQQLSCFDMMYFATTSSTLYEWEKPWCPMWRFIGQHIHFTTKWMDLAVMYLSKALEVNQDDIPPFIAVHVRRGDFENACKDGRTSPSCGIPLSTFADHVESVQQQLLQINGEKVEKVILFSDEKDPKFWDDVKARGWYRIDHDKEETERKYDGWHPALLDVVIQSMASGFVGTTGSTFSLLSLKRVESWNNGIGVLARAPGF